MVGVRMTGYIAAALIGAAIAGFTVWEAQEVRIARIKMQHAETHAQAAAQALATTAQMQKDKDDAIQQAQERAQQNAAAAAAARRTADSLREQLSTAQQRIATASVSAVAEYAATASAVLGECIGEYQALAEKADGHASTVRLMQDSWPSLSKP